jgi:hypothetical protein
MISTTAHHVKSAKLSSGPPAEICTTSVILVARAGRARVRGSGELCPDPVSVIAITPMSRHIIAMRSDLVKGWRRRPASAAECARRWRVRFALSSASRVRAHEWPAQVVLVLGAVAIAAVVFVVGLLVGAGMAPWLGE